MAIAQNSHDGGGARAPAQTRRDQPTRRSPEEVVTGAQERVQKLERALEVLGEDSGPEFQVLQNSLKKAKAAAQGVPIGAVGTVSEIRRTNGEAVASPRRRAREGGQVVGGSATTCCTVAFRVGS